MQEATAIAARQLRRAVLLNSEGLELTNFEDMLDDNDFDENNEDDVEDDDHESEFV